MKSKIILIILLAIGFWVRLYKIDNPVADWHSWRQADTAAVTRNYIKYGIDLFHPRYDDFSDVSGKGLFNPEGYRFVEFPIYNLIHFTFYKVFGHFSLEIWGRLTTIFASLISGLLLYLIVKKHTQNELISLAAAFSFLFIPYNIYYSRVILPDPLMVTFFLAAIYFSESNFILTVLFSILAVLVKPVAIFFLLPIFWSYKISKKSLLIGFLCFGFFGLWRLWSYRFPQGVPASAWLLNGNHIRFKPAFFGWIFHERLGQLILGVWGLPLFVLGFLNAFIPKYKYFITWGLASLIYLCTFATGNIQHDYYQIPIIPSVCIFLALGVYEIGRFKNGWLYTMVSRILIVFSIVIMLYFGWYDVVGNGIKGYYQVNHWEIVHAGLAVDRLTPKDAIVVAPYLGDTAFLYQTNRRGFPILALPIKDLHDRFNVNFYVSINYDADTKAIMDKYTVIEQTPEYVVVKLVEKPQLNLYNPVISSQQYYEVKPTTQNGVIVSPIIKQGDKSFVLSVPLPLGWQNTHSAFYDYGKGIYSYQVLLQKQDGLYQLGISKGDTETTKCIFSDTDPPTSRDRYFINFAQFQSVETQFGTLRLVQVLPASHPNRAFFSFCQKDESIGRNIWAYNTKIGNLGFELPSSFDPAVLNEIVNIVKNIKFEAK